MITLNELPKILDEMGVPRRRYSINGNLIGDAHMLNHVYYYWEYFYDDEKGNQLNYKKFTDEHEACIFFIELFESKGYKRVVDKK